MLSILRDAFHRAGLLSGKFEMQNQLDSDLQRVASNSDPDAFEVEIVTTAGDVATTRVTSSMAIIPVVRTALALRTNDEVLVTCAVDIDHDAATFEDYDIGDGARISARIRPGGLLLHVLPHWFFIHQQRALWTAELAQLDTSRWSNHI